MFLRSRTLARAVFTAVVGLFVCTAAPSLAIAPETVNEAIRTLLTVPGTLRVATQPINREDIRPVYEANGYSPLWSDAETVDQVLGALRGAARDGLDPVDYPIAAIAERADSQTPQARAERDLLISDTVVRFAGDLSAGRTSPRRLDPELFAQPKEIDGPAVLSAVAAGENPAVVLAGYAPQNVYYRRLRRALALYRKIAANGGWAEVPAGPTLRVGDSGPRVLALRERLAASGDLKGASHPPHLFDPLLASAVAGFQRRHGLIADRAVGPRTLAALNVPVEARVAQIVVNMERWRWMAEDFGDRYVVVNLAGFDLEVIDSGSVALDMRVVVGRPYRRSPVFSDRIQYIELNPTWTVPPTILRNDILPKFRKDPLQAEKQGFRIYSGWGDGARELDPAAIDWVGMGAAARSLRVVQSPGPQNALGQMKFMFPNRFDVYLHDTPSRELFAREIRSFSSGCIRVERPFALAALLLADAGWDEDRLREAVESGRRQIVRLTTPVPVHLTYATAWIGEGGDVHFREDVYGRDAVLARALPGVHPRRG